MLEGGAPETLRSFVGAVLARSGVEHVWLDGRRVRVRPHPAFAELFGEAASLELALDEAAAQEYPGATLCSPGSFALDQLISWCRNIPGVYHTRLPTAGLSEPPPGLPAVENGLLEAAPGGSVERHVLYALFRVSVDSDELVEELVPILLQDTGAAPPGTVQRFESLPREPQSAAVPAVPEDLLERLESAAAEAARRLAEEQLPVIEVRKIGELRRLEEYLRALRDDLGRELPAGAVRRAAEIRRKCRARLDLLRSVLPGDGPWDRETVLESLFPKPRFRLPVPIVTGHADPQRVLAGSSPRVLRLDRESQHLVAELLRRLPRSFTTGDVEALIGRDETMRLARLARNAGEEEAAPGEVLEDHEQRLEEEHRRRVADIEEKFHVRALATPVLLEWLDYTAPQYRLAVAGLPGTPLHASWDPVSAEWDLSPCPGCGAVHVRSLWLCEREHLACGACAGVCAHCRRARCPSCAFGVCAVCEEPACPDCGLECARCGAWNCGRHAARCPECGAAGCVRCGGGCRVCQAPLCPEHHAACALCAAAVCREHTLRCSFCERPACPEHGDRCPACGRVHCTDHAAACRFCGERYCTACAGSSGRCATCRELERVGPATAAALRSRLDQLAPGSKASRFRHLWLARNSRRQIVVARRRLWNHVYVMDEDGSALRSHRRYLSWRGP